MNARIWGLLLCLPLAGCGLMGNREATTYTPPPETDLTPAPEPSLAAGPSASAIKGILAGKSWRWTGPKFSGTTLYASDGTSLVEVDGKGQTKGKWIAKDGQLCESLTPTTFLPREVANMTCRSFSGSGNVYQVGKATFTLAS
jgi:hypothetical protein